MFQCIGQKKTSDGLIRCINTSETPNNENHPEWGFLCSSCANSPAVRNSPTTEAANVSAMQSDPREYKDQMEAGFMTGIRGSALSEEGE